MSSKLSFTKEPTTALTLMGDKFILNVKSVEIDEEKKTGVFVTDERLYNQKEFSRIHILGSCGSKKNCINRVISKITIVRQEQNAYNFTYKTLI